MAIITFKDTPVEISGELPAVGQPAPETALTAGDLSDKTLRDFEAKAKVLNIVPSLDTSVCAASARAFNEKVNALDQAVVLCVSVDLPFAMGRFCEGEGLQNIVPLSAFRSDFGAKYGVIMKDGPLRGLFCRAVLVLDQEDVVQYCELVPEIAQEPDYEAALAVVEQLTHS